MKTSRIIANKEAEQLIRQLQDEFKDEELIFHQAGGCCEGSKPSLYKKKRFRLRKNDVCIGQVAGIDFWVDKDLYQYWQYTQFQLNVVDGVGAGGFSLETSKGKTFITEHLLLTNEEKEVLDKQLKFNT